MPGRTGLWGTLNPPAPSVVSGDSSEECGQRRSRGRCSQRVCVWCQLSGQATWTTQTAPKTSTPQTNPMTPMPIMPGPGPVKLRCRSGPFSCASNRLCVSVCVGACRCACIGLRARVCVSVGSNEGGASRVSSWAQIMSPYFSRRLDVCLARLCEHKANASLLFPPVLPPLFCFFLCAQGPRLLASTTPTAERAPTRKPSPKRDALSPKP